MGSQLGLSGFGMVKLYLEARGAQDEGWTLTNQWFSENPGRFLERFLKLVFKLVFRKVFFKAGSLIESPALSLLL